MKNIVLLLTIVFVTACTPKHITSKENYRDGKLHGEYIMYFDGNPTMVGNYEDGKRIGEWMRYYPDGRKFEKANYVDDKLQGEWIGYHSSQGIRERGHYTDDKKSGEWTSYYEEGVTYLGRGVDGDPAFTTNLEKEVGQIREKGEYIEGKKNGSWYYYDEDGNLLKIEEYIDGEVLLVKLEGM